MQGKNKSSGIEREKTMVAKSFEEFFKVKKDKKFNKIERMKNKNVKKIRSFAEAEEWDDLDEEDKYTDEEDWAKNNLKGLWQGEFLEPWKWRKK